MSFQPVVPMGGYAGWLSLKRTLPAQEAAWKSSQVNRREADYFREKIATVTSADDLVSDRRLLKVALTAFGLDQDINSKAFIRKVLSDGVDSAKDLANRLADKSYRNFSDAFGLDGSQLPKTLEDGFADQVLEKYYSRQFETAIGNQNQSFRLAMNAERELANIANSSSGEDTKWFMIMGSKPLRSVFETAFGLPAGFGNLDIDQQLRTLKGRAQSQFSDSGVSQFSDAKKMSKLVQNYLIRDSISTSGVSPAQNALQLLSNISRR